MPPKGVFLKSKNRKIEKIDFFRACCVHCQNFLRDNSLILYSSPKIFLLILEMFLSNKILIKKKEKRKITRTTEILKKNKKKKIEKIKNPADRPKSVKYFWEVN